jgi:hypothetical protein
MLVFGLVIFGYCAFKGFRDFTDGYPGHVDRWRFLRQVRSVWVHNSGYRVRIMGSMRAEGLAVLESVRSETRVYKAEILKTQREAADCLAHLTALQEALPRHAQEFVDTAKTFFGGGGSKSPTGSSIGPARSVMACVGAP